MTTPAPYPEKALSSEHRTREPSFMSNPTSETPTQPVATDGQTHLNGAVTSTPPAAARPAGAETATSRAENMVDNLAVQVAVATSYVGKGFLRVVARLREEMSDIWADAQNLRRGDKP